MSRSHVLRFLAFALPVAVLVIMLFEYLKAVLR